MKDLRTSLKLTVIAFIACALTTAVLYSVLDGNEWFARSLGAIALVAVLGGAARAARVPRPLIPLLQLAAVLVYVTVTYVPNDANSGWLPGRAALRSLRGLGDGAFEELKTLTPPVTPSPGMTLLIVSGVALMAILVDAFAAGYRQTALAGLPLLVLYIVPVVVLPDGVHGALFLLPAIGYLLLLITDNRERLLRWGVAVSGRPGEETGRSAGELGQLTRRIGVTVLSMSLAIPALAPRLSDGAIGAGGIGNDPSGGGTISTLNPLVSMRRDLVRPADVDLMRVRTDSTQPNELYLRAVTLDTFDGEEWRAGRREVRRFDAGLPDPVGLPESVPATPVTTTITVGEVLQTDYVPMPFPATRLEIDGAWRVDPLTANVVSREGADQLTGRDYGVRSLDLDPKPTDVLPSLAIEPYLKPYLQLPEALPNRVKELADRVTRNADTVLGKGIALQQWFRNPDNFTYDLRQRPGTGKNAILSFLQDRRGYCEQFAATMAVMARHVGIPARINVGFTPGKPQADGTRVISAHDAHAWPELFMPGVGWTRFEPTPGSATSNPNVPDWLAPAPGDEPPGGADDPGSETEETPAPADGLAGASAPPDPATPAEGSLVPLPVTGPEDCFAPQVFDPKTKQCRNEQDPWYQRWWKLEALGLALVLLAATPAALRALIRRRRWAQARAGSVATGEIAWVELRDDALDLGYTWPESRTPRTTSLTLATDGELPVAGSEALAMITQHVERSRYAPGGAAEPGGEHLRNAVAEVRRGLAETAGRSRRVRSLVLPASVAATLRGGLLRAQRRSATARQSMLRGRRA